MSTGNSPGPVRAGLIGCGNISDIYFKNCQELEAIEIVACADLVEKRAQEKAKQHNVPKALKTETLLNDPEIEMVINLTVPAAHGTLGMQSLEHGKSYYTEKPLATTRKEGEAMLGLAKQKGLRLGAAPDTFMGAGLQTCRKLIDAGAIGQPVAATAFCVGHGHETWHPDPEFFYKPGGGPLFDMGPYYLTALINLIGPFKAVSAMGKTSFAERIISTQPHRGKTIKVETPTHLSGAIESVDGVLVTMIMSFDIWAASLPFLEIHGTEASMRLPDPNYFDGPVFVRRPGEEDWWPVQLTHGYAENMRGLGPADMACAIRSGRPHRASGDMAFHVLDTMHCFLDSVARGITVNIPSRCERPAPMPESLKHGRLDP